MTSGGDKAPAGADLEVRSLSAADLPEVVRIDALHTGERKPDYWAGIIPEFVRPDRRDRVALVAGSEGRLIGFLMGEVRAFEFGSEACGWIFAVGVDVEHARKGVASALLGEACARFRRAGVSRVRTMVRRNDVAVLSFFRANRFTGGSFVQLEREIDEAPVSGQPHGRDL